MHHQANNHNNNTFSPDQDIEDFYDSCHYKQLWDSSVVLNGHLLPYNYFSDEQDVLLMLMTNSFQLFKHGSMMGWPLLVLNGNLPPSEHVKQQNAISLGLIPSPCKPKDFNSFLLPLVLEAHRLAEGVNAIDGFAKE